MRILRLFSGKRGLKAAPINGVWVCIALIALTAGQPASAMPSIGVTVDGRAIAVDQAPIMQDGRVLVPLRGVFEALGATLSYNAATHQVTAQRGDETLQLTLNSATALVNGQTVPLDVPAQSIGGRTMVPLRFISETLGAKVAWDAADRTVAITSGSAPSAIYEPPQPPQQNVVVMPAPVPESPEITSVDLNTSGPLHRGDLLKISVLGTPDSTATVSVQGLADNLPMEEKAPGHYEARYTIPADAPISTEPITVVAYLSRDGMETAQEATSTLSVAPQVGNIFVDVTSPFKHEKVASDFVVAGRTLPFATVQVECSHNIRATGQADAKGNFSIPVHMGYASGRHHVDLNVTAIDQDGRVSKRQHYSIAVGE